VFIRALQNADGPGLLMLLLAATCGLRRAEIARLHTDDFFAGKVRVKGKGGRVRAVPVVNEDVRRMLADLPEGWLFPGRFGGHATPDHVGRRLSGLLGPGWTGHTLRHRYSSVVFAGSHDILALQKLLGHSSPETTQRYVEVDDEAMWAAARHAA
jgi:integrase